MRVTPTIAAALALGAASLSPAQAGVSSVLTIHSNYTTRELLSPCQEADNDARWGEAAEIECEQYLIGFVNALDVTGQLGPEVGICLPEDNVADEVRWAFMRWVHASYSERIAMPAAQSVMDTLKDSFPCE
ncbi:Rap1a/Tai family immunity protein [Tropicimonas isoalkanivorans]|uniref:Rap1a immunity protein domain-containing protein n=1 Tax=Tropicimonas isoalkanivorans TaxID=441112 RepID=A0A1I1EMS6_9RHOB|nr:Rap1a/Tai family immunity protein [Tropicimonas isoalkanivorans]SFB86213.1 hypothetical protein SAMN04488094_101802 [Tropicimonas isoalkanivorans]